MNEIQEILNIVNKELDGLILATVVDVVGSAYRRPGARMLILPGGDHIGTISGGCLERDLCREAKSIVKDGPKLISFDTRSDSTNFNPRYNLGCSGIIYVLVERLTGKANCPLAPIKRVYQTLKPEIVGTVYQSELEQFKIGDRLSRTTLLEISGSMNCFVERAQANGKRICCQLTDNDHNARILIERLDPPRPLLIFGAGYDAIPLVSIAAQMGWDVTVIDDRPEQLTRERFPCADRFLCVSPAQAPEHLQPNDRTIAILMTHSFSKDTKLLPWLLEGDARYVGILGPKSRTGKVIRQLHAENDLPATESLDKLHTPVGLDIGAANPAEIAIAIVAEVIAEINQRHGGNLADRTDPIHEPVQHELIQLLHSNSTNALT